MGKKRTLIFILCLMIAAAGIGYLVYGFTLHQKEKQTNEDLQKIAVSEESSEKKEVIKEQYISSIDFKSLQEVNDDIYAWIKIPGTAIDYAIVQHDSIDDYYLTYSADGTYARHGAIFTDCENDKTFSQFNEVIYGHNKGDELMFGGLKHYRDRNYLEEHRFIYIYTPDAMRTYKVFAAVTYDDSLITDKYPNGNLEKQQAFLDSLWAARDLNSIIVDDVEVTSESRIITLSTCISKMKHNRFIVVGVLVDEQK